VLMSSTLNHMRVITRWLYTLPRVPSATSRRAHNSFERSLARVFRASFWRLTAHDRRKMCGVRGPNTAAIRRTVCQYGMRNRTPAAPPPGDVEASPSRVGPVRISSARIFRFTSRFEKGPKPAKYPN
jgi:hypothetical protein